MNEPIRVVDVRGFRGVSPQPFIYVGRKMHRMPAFNQGHPLANWLRLPVSHEQTAGTYTEWLDSLPDLEAQLAELLAHVRATGLPLGCWCCDWDGLSRPYPECHAVVLALRLMALDRKGGM